MQKLFLISRFIFMYDICRKELSQNKMHFITVPNLICISRKFFNRTFSCEKGRGDVENAIQNPI